MSLLAPWRRARPVDPEIWAEVVADSPLLGAFDIGARERLRELAGRFLGAKSIEGAGGLELDQRIRTTIAGLACVPILELGLDWYAGWRSVIVYPADFVATHTYVDEAGVVHEEVRELSGEAWPRGPMVLSWEGVEESARGEVWGNVVLHECAHKLDLLDGDANGMPPLHAGMDERAWTDAFTAAYHDFAALVDAGEDIPFDEYAADDPGEFFAVVCESFFCDPDIVESWYPEVYDRLREFFRQDPLTRLSASP
ncbi:MAG: zinc-dependent peptidase [Ectothiorhodospiraceae bacterium]|nr:zinc-dependent peptidase [Chromatiales bacterium]MCP5153481.1 zinc-dependent peptidase [Ectothiorhodospiraceae bacterium]